ncbi:MAG: hypothetical protein JNM00_02160 [Flavobacteriales bacterium]|nr:hypothetical protein [Flavobacteriales bacterium]
MKSLFYSSGWHSFLLGSILLMMCETLTAQVPQGINYQAVLRDSNGEILSNQNITLRLTIELASNGNNLYRETHTVVTGEQGLVNVILGQGTVVLGTFNTINWNQALMLQVEVNPGGGYVDMGSTSLLSVPYALRSDKALDMELKDLVNVAASNPQIGEVLKFNGTNWLPQPDDGNTYTAGNGISITGNAIANTGDTNASDDLTVTTTFSGDVIGNYNTMQLVQNSVGNNEMADNAIGSAEISNASITAADLGSNSVGADEISEGAVTGSEILDGSITNADLNAMGASNGQVLKYNGTAWFPSTDNGANYSAGTGITISGNTINSNWATNSAFEEVSLANGQYAVNIGAGHAYSKLQVHDPLEDFAHVRFSNNLTAASATTGVLFGINEYDMEFINMETGGNIRFHLNDQERVTITENGYVGIANTNPQAALEVNGAVIYDPTVLIHNGGTLTVTTQNKSYIRISSNHNPLTATLDLSDGSAIGHFLIIENTGVVNNQGWYLIDEDIENLELSGDFEMTGGDTITLIWNGSLWTEIARKDN